MSTLLNVSHSDVFVLSNQHALTIGGSIEGWKEEVGSFHLMSVNLYPIGSNHGKTEGFRLLDFASGSVWICIASEYRGPRGSVHLLLFVTALKKVEDPCCKEAFFLMHIWKGD